MHAITLEDALFFIVPVRFKISTGIAISSSHHVVVVKRGDKSGVGEGFSHLHRAMSFLKRHADKLLNLASKYDFEGLRDIARIGKLRLPMALEMALLDLSAKEEGLGACELMGRPVRKKVRVFRTIPLGRKDEVVRIASRLASEGWGIKLKIGMGAEPDLELVKAVRGAVGPDVPLIVDVNQAYPPGVALRLLRRMERYGLYSIEQPCFRTDLRAHSVLKKALDTPIMLDESVRDVEELEKAVEAGAIDVLNLKICRVGGLFRALNILEACVDMGVRLYIGTGRELGVGAATLLHMASLIPEELFWGCEIGWWFFIGFDILKRPLAFRNGEMEVPSGPGLGVEIADEAWLRRQVERRGGLFIKLENIGRMARVKSMLLSASERLISLPWLLAKSYYSVNELIAKMRGR